MYARTTHVHPTCYVGNRVNPRLALESRFGDFGCGLNPRLSHGIPNLNLNLDYVWPILNPFFLNPCMYVNE